MKPLEPPDVYHLRAAEGWVELGNFEEANEELERIAPHLRVHPEALAIRWEVSAHAKKWNLCVDIADAILKLAPEYPFGWIHRSFALHALRRTEEAFDNLLHVAEMFPKAWTVPFNLAWYCSQLGRFQEAQLWIKKAIDIDDRAVQVAVADDPDLKPLWDCMSGTIGKRTV
jgi:tetratricopeptide (TPR) repeat protein